MFNKSDISRDEFMLTKGQAKCGYDWWWHSFTGHNEKQVKKNHFLLSFFFVIQQVVKMNLFLDN